MSSVTHLMLKDTFVCKLVIIASLSVQLSTNCTLASDLCGVDSSGMAKRGQEKKRTGLRTVGGIFVLVFYCCIKFTKGCGRSVS